MFFRFLGKLFFYFWILPVVNDVLKSLATTALKQFVDNDRRKTQERNRRSAPPSDPMDHAPLT